MRKIHKSVFAVVLVLILAMPAGAAGWPSSGRGSVIQAVKRFVIGVLGRIGVPGGSPTEDEPEEPATTDELTQTQ